MTDARKLWPAPGKERLHWGWLAGKLGASADLPRPFLFCIRGAEAGANETHPMRSVAKYDDTGVVVYRGGERVFRMSSHAYQVNSRISPDVDGDGLGDVGTIKPGRYIARDLKTGKYPTFLVTMPDGDGHLPCWRDTSHDGVIDHEELARAYTATQILIHGGLDDPPDSPHHFSIGCQCVPLEDRRFLVERCTATGSGVMDYVVAEADAVIALVAEMPEWPEPPKASA